MRPLELELTAFRSYDRATIDLRPYERVVITGDTGAGKSSLLDAICFALFGRTPEQTRPRELLTLGHSHGEVRLTFSARGEVWRATRRYGRDAPEPAHLLERPTAGRRWRRCPARPRSRGACPPWWAWASPPSPARCC